MDKLDHDDLKILIGMVVGISCIVAGAMLMIIGLTK